MLPISMTRFELLIAIVHQMKAELQVLTAIE